MAEQFAFEQGFGDGTHVHCYHIPPVSVGQGVYFPRQHFFPVPFSPVIRILASVCATFSISVRSCFMALLSPQYIEDTVLGISALFLFLEELRQADSKVSISRALSQGLTMKSVAPSLMPRTARSMSA